MKCCRNKVPLNTVEQSFLEKRKLETLDIKDFQSYNSNVRERIRTPDTLVRSQVLYPAELHTHI